MLKMSVQKVSSIVSTRFEVCKTNKSHFDKLQLSNKT